MIFMLVVYNHLLSVILMILFRIRLISSKEREKKRKWREKKKIIINEKGKSFKNQMTFFFLFD